MVDAAPTGKKTGGKASRQKGDRFESSVVDQLRQAGFTAQRVPLSGAAGGMFTGDLQFVSPRDYITRKIECKNRARGFGDLYKWLVDNYALCIKRDRAETLVVLRMADFIALSQEKF